MAKKQSRSSRKQAERKREKRRGKQLKQALIIPGSDPSNQRKFPHLSMPQEKVVLALSNGSTYKNAALLAKVSRQTIYNWLKTDLAFRTVLDDEKQKIMGEANHTIVGSLQSAAHIVKSAIEAGDEKLAFAVLKETGMLAVINPLAAKQAMSSEEVDQKGKALIRLLMSAIEKAKQEDPQEKQIVTADKVHTPQISSS